MTRPGTPMPPLLRTTDGDSNPPPPLEEDVAPHEMPAELPAESARKYRLIAELGRGGMATAYLAVMQGPAGFNKFQVVKQLRPALAADPEFLQMFLAEARLAARVSHPNVVQTNEVGFDGSAYFIAMEYLEGQSLQTIFARAKKTGPVPISISLRIFADVLAGLHSAHELKAFDGTALEVVHRDMSPHNVMVTYEGAAKVLDFGIAKTSDSVGKTRTGVLKGKVAYMAPEQIGGDHVDRRADVFGVGVMMWRALSGEKLWAGKSDFDIISALATSAIPKPSSVNENVPEQLEAICMKALSPRAEDRYATAAEFEIAIEDYIETHGPRATSRDVAKYVSQMFAAERAEVQTAIEAHLRAAPSSVSDVRTIGAVPPLREVTAGSMDSEAAARGTGSAAATNAQGGSRSGARWVLGGAITAATIALAAGYAIRSARPVAAVPSVVPAAAHPVADARPGPREPVAPAAPAMTSVTIRTTPPTAELHLDDVLLGSSPMTRSFPRASTVHRLHIEAAGYVSRDESLVFDTENMTVDLALERTPIAAPAPVIVRRGSSRGNSAHTETPPPAVTTAPAPVPQAPSPTLPPPQSQAPQNGGIDRGDPWAH